MSWLLWKDYRENRVAVYSALFFMAVPHLIALGAVCREAWLGIAPHYPNQWAGYFAGAAIYGFMFAQLSIAVIGGNAFSGERSERSAEFLFSLPISRGKILLSKLLVSLALILAIWLITALILVTLAAACHKLTDLNPRDIVEFKHFVGLTAIVSAAFFCVAWCLSSFLRNSTVAVLGGILTPWLILTAVMLVAYLLDVDLDTFGNRAMVPFKWICLTLAPPCFALGTWYYLQRVEP